MIFLEGNFDGEGTEDLDEQRELGVNPVQNAMQNKIQEILPNMAQEPSVNKGETEKLAKFFSNMQVPEFAIQHFYGFLNAQQLYGFPQRINAQVMSIMLDKACYSYLNSLAPSKFTREHTLSLENIKALYQALLSSAVGTDKNVINARTTLNELRITRGYGDINPKQKGFISRMF